MVDIHETQHGLAADPLVREALSAGGVGVWRWNLSKDQFSADDTARQLWGLPRGELRGESVLEAIDPADGERVRAVAAAARDGEDDVELVVRPRRPAGETRWVQIRARSFEDFEGRHLAGVVIDVTDRRRVETALSTTEMRLRRAQELGGAHAFEWDARTDTVVAPAGFRALYGFGAKEPVDLALFLSRIHPGDRERVEKDQRRLIASPGRYESEFRIVLPDGGTRWILSRGESVRDPEGRTTGLAGINIDITSRREVEEELRRSKREARARFRELRALYQNAPVGLALLDLDLRVVRVNGFLSNMVRSVPEMFVGRPLFDNLPDLRPHLEPALEKVRGTRAAVRNLAVEAAAPDEPGAKVYWNFHVYYLSDDYGATPGIGLVVEDVSAQKRTEQARDLLSRELSHRIKNLFAVVASLVTLSARGNATLQRFAETIRGRIEALGRAHDYVRPVEWGPGTQAEPATLHRLLDGVLAPYRSDRTDRICLQGADPVIGPSAATGLALAIHEFATNAVKYGALSRREGFVTLACRDEGDTVELVWSESGGPTVSGPPAHEGFGSSLAQRSITRNLDGTMATEWLASGLTIRLMLPKDQLTR